MYQVITAGVQIADSSISECKTTIRTKLSVLEDTVETKNDQMLYKLVLFYVDKLREEFDIKLGIVGISLQFGPKETLVEFHTTKDNSSELLRASIYAVNVTRAIVNKLAPTK